MSQSLNQAAIDEAIALGIDLQFDDLYLTINDPDDIALKIKQKEEGLSIQADEEYAKMLQLQEDEELAKTLNAMEENPPNIPQPDVPSTSRGTSGLNDGDRPQDQPTLVVNPINSESNNLPNQTAIENNNPENGLGESTEEVNKEGLPKNIISGLPTQKYSRKTWWCSKKTFVPDKKECSICIVDYEKGDKITTLPCKHAFHKDCISNWLKENKVCCECQAEVVP
ncbi:Zinc finger RING-type [Arabidopsis thaliana x Arabidopsis arenosa]|uniref:Zinc finger RING-type n=1 Tax=Arabidopsis thaliana x Arabidopsis arenosa TaxID=1240361 RepID=A0A8T1XI93_9BRAS|nr:Zinc finger RING-type [Arabidopsis thaliana x Arabidopsis arenosa]